MARAHARIGTTDFLTHITANGRTLEADEPVDLGGQGAGFTPFELLLTSLGACTAITLRMYAERKTWPLTAVDVDLLHYKVDDRSHIERVLSFEGDLTAEQRARLADIAERTPVTLTLKNGANIATSVKDGSEISHG